MRFSEMYVTEAMIDRLAGQYGRPERRSFTFPTDDTEFRRIRATQKYGRRHDFTLYIVNDGRIVVIAKHSYPPGLYRAPSGGLRPREDAVDGIHREALEETGCEIRLRKFLLRTDVSFESTLGTIDWCSFVLRADYLSGDFAFTDHREIREVRLAAPEEFERFSAIMRRTTVAGLHYRAALHDAVRRLPQWIG